MGGYEELVRNLDTVVYHRPLINRFENFVTPPVRYSEHGWTNRPSHVDSMFMDRAAKIKRNNAAHINPGVPVQPGLPHIPAGRRLTRAILLMEAQNKARRAQDRQQEVGRLVKPLARGRLQKVLVQNNPHAQSRGKNLMYTDINTRNTVTMPRDAFQTDIGTPIGASGGVYIRPVVSRSTPLSLRHRTAPSQAGSKWSGAMRTVDLQPQANKLIVDPADEDPLRLSAVRAHANAVRRAIAGNGM